ncbi:MAG TPA: adenylate/guanylate cyclase domain-containing protein [Actinomycetes bacterium]|nr:adenylate/guanylate cyclase domain-containing protein [Actinomycetes bacterium]
MQPETKYARLGDDRIAYQVLGEGPPDLVLTMGAFGHVDLQWEDPGIALFLRGLASFTRLVAFDRRGTGASDPLPDDAPPPWEAYADEVTAVMDAVGSRQAALMATTAEAGPMALFFAATRPERTSALIVGNATARYVAADDYPIGIPPEQAEAIISRVEDTWGTGDRIADGIPSRAGDERFRRWMARIQRSIASPRTVHTFLRALFRVDVRPLLPLIQAPTLVLHRRDFPMLPIEHGRYLAEHIPGARLVELPGSDGPLAWETPELTLRHIEEFLTGAPRTAPTSRVLATVLFTDIVASTERAAELGDRRWRELLQVHDDLANRLVERWGGRVVKTTGDGMLATFDGPGRAIGCVVALRDQLGDIDVQVRAGLHAGEVELRGDDVGGIAVHIASRVMATAGAGEIVVSRTVRDLVAGSDITLQDRGSRRLKGVDGVWQLFAVADR